MCRPRPARAHDDGPRTKWWTRACAFAAVGLVVLAPSPGVAQATGALSGFEGSVEKGAYETEFDVLVYATSAAADAPVERVEGALLSRVFAKPEAKSNLEVFRSYQSVLEAGGFTVRLATEAGRETELLVRKLYRPPHSPGFNTRSYQPKDDRVSRIDLDRIATQADYYLVASRIQGGEAHWISVVIGRSANLYLIEELTTAVMETGTVSLDLDRLRSEIAEAGKIAIYDIQFATGSAVIEPESADALSVIAAYLNENPASFYIVGHTDDTGTLEANVVLSEERAAAVKEALVAREGIEAGRLHTRGVGPLAPVSNNTGEAGRALNRRVEIVQRLGGG